MPDTRLAVLADLSIATENAPVWLAAARTALPRLKASSVREATVSEVSAACSAPDTALAARS